jgi:DNA-binding FadR family transcriptional regulator
VDEHIAMVQALEARDPAALRQVLMHHLDNKRNVVIDQLRAVRHSIDSTPDTSFQTEGHAP